MRLDLAFVVLVLLIASCGPSPRPSDTPTDSSHGGKGAADPAPMSTNVAGGAHSDVTGPNTNSGHSGGTAIPDAGLGEMGFASGAAAGSKQPATAGISAQPAVAGVSKQPPTGGISGQPTTGGESGFDSSATCSEAGTDCTDDSETCCAGDICVRDGRSATCRARCTESSQCVSGCCGSTTLGDHVCSLPQYCGLCVAPGNACTGDECCPGATCTIDGQGLTYCADNCTKNSDCMSGCCAQLSNSTAKICSDISYCIAD
jgi:hypothetical protein